MIELTTIYCPECGDAAEDMAPENGQDVPGGARVPARGGPDGAVPGADPRRRSGRPSRSRATDEVDV